MSEQRYDHDGNSCCNIEKECVGREGYDVKKKGAAVAAQKEWKQYNDRDYRVHTDDRDREWEEQVEGYFFLCLCYHTSNLYYTKG